MINFKAALVGARGFGAGQYVGEVAAEDGYCHLIFFPTKGATLRVNDEGCVPGKEGASKKVPMVRNVQEDVAPFAVTLEDIVDAIGSQEMAIDALIQSVQSQENAIDDLRDLVAGLGVTFGAVSRQDLSVKGFMARSDKVTLSDKDGDQ